MFRLRWVLVVLFLKYYIFSTAQGKAPLIDKNATTETKILAHNLYVLSKKHILFGHQHATEYGHGWFGDANRSDVKSVTGSHPAVVGVDIMGLSGLPEAAIEKNLLHLSENISATDNRGGVTTVAWHFSNPASGGGFYWKDSVSKPAVGLIIPGGSHHEQYKKILSTVARFANNTKGADGKLVPMIFRPFHEFDGGWFWWGKPHCTKEDFISLWQFTVSYLRDSLNIHNFIYAFSPDNKFLTTEQFLDRYPGNNWVDLLGMDNYGDFGRDGKYNIDAGIKKLLIVSEYAEKIGKLAAFTETGLEAIPNPKWWTDVLLKTLRTKGMRLSYVLVWRNDSRSVSHFYAPFPGHSSVPDFMLFYRDSYSWFENDLTGIYSSRW